MKKIYLKLQRVIEKDLNEYVKWVIMIGIYLFYRMMEKAYPESKISFLFIPLIFLAVIVFISDWIIKDMIGSVQKSSDVSNEPSKENRPKVISTMVAACIYLSILFFIVFYLLNYVPLINAGFLLLLSSALLARLQDASDIGGKSNWIKWATAGLILLGIAGLIHAFVYNNSLNDVTFVFYVGFILFYFVNLYFFNPKNAQHFSP